MAQVHRPAPSRPWDLRCATTPSRSLARRTVAQARPAPSASAFTSLCGTGPPASRSRKNVSGCSLGVARPAVCEDRIGHGRSSRAPRPGRPSGRESAGHRRPRAASVRAGLGQDSAPRGRPSSGRSGPENRKSSYSGHLQNPQNVDYRLWAAPPQPVRKVLKVLRVSRLPVFGIFGREASRGVDRPWLTPSRPG